jgi:hypothetical protein
MIRKRPFFYYIVVIICCLLVLPAEAPAPLISPGDIDLYRQLGLRLAPKDTSRQNSLELLCIVEDPGILKKHGMTDVSKGDKVRLSQKAKNLWRIVNEATQSVLTIEVDIGEFYD